MGMRDDIMSELGFLDDTIVAFDEKPKSVKEQDLSNRKSLINEEVPDVSINQGLLSMIDGLSDEAALAVIDAFNKIPKEIKDEVVSVYNTMRHLGGDSSIEDVKKALLKLRDTCGEEYKGVYEDAVKDAKRYVPKIQTRQMMESLE